MLRGKDTTTDMKIHNTPALHKAEQLFLLISTCHGAIHLLGSHTGLAEALLLSYKSEDRSVFLLYHRLLV